MCCWITNHFHFMVFEWLRFVFYYNLPSPHEQADTRQIIMLIKRFKGAQIYSILSQVRIFHSRSSKVYSGKMRNFLLFQQIRYLNKFERWPMIRANKLDAVTLFRGVQQGAIRQWYDLYDFHTLIVWFLTRQTREKEREKTSGMRIKGLIRINFKTLNHSQKSVRRSSTLIFNSN